MTGSDRPGTLVQRIVDNQLLGGNNVSSLLSANPLLTVAVILGFAWVTLFVSELIAWRRGHSIVDEFRDEPPSPAKDQPIKGPWKWLLVTGSMVILIPAAIVSMVILLPPLMAVKGISRLTRRCS